jgi:hypothetical protein
VLTPTSSPSPFSAILAEPDEGEDLASGPNISSREFRRIVYRPVQLPEKGQPIVRVEIEYEGEAATRRRIVESTVDMMVPTG